MARHTWIWKKNSGANVLTCDACERQAPSWVRNERDLPEGGCPGSAFEQQQAGDSAILPGRDYLLGARARGYTAQQIAKAWFVAPDKVSAALRALD